MQTYSALSISCSHFPLELTEDTNPQLTHKGKIWVSFVSSESQQNYSFLAVVFKITFYLTMICQESIVLRDKYKTLVFAMLICWRWGNNTRSLQYDWYIYIYWCISKYLWIFIISLGHIFSLTLSIVSNVCPKDKVREGITPTVCCWGLRGVCLSRSYQELLVYT